MFDLIIVDDDETLLEGMTTVVDWNALGFRVAFAARDGVEAFNALETVPCDVLITDICMGRMDGLELVRRTREKYPDIAVVMMSAYEDFSYAQQAVRLGVKDYLLKPIDLQLLKATMHSVYAHLSESRAEKEKIERIQDRMKGFGQMRAEDYLQASSAQYAALVDHIAKLILVGNWKEAAVYLNKLEKKLFQAGDSAFLAMLSSVNLLVGRMESEESLTAEQLNKLHRMQEQIIAAPSFSAGMDALKETLQFIAQEIGCTADDVAALMNQAAAYVDAHFAEPGLRLKDAAQYVGLSTNYFSSLFVRHMGTGFSEYLIDKRMREALLLMSNTEKKIYEIARMVGYENPAYFSAAFRKYTGVSVSDFRRNIRGVSENES